MSGIRRERVTFLRLEALLRMSNNVRENGVSAVNDTFLPGRPQVSRTSAEDRTKLSRQMNNADSQTPLAQQKQRAILSAFGDIAGLGHDAISDRETQKRE